MPQPNGQLTTSRYAATAVAWWSAPDGRSVPYLELRRPIAAPLVGVHAVRQGDRLDLLAQAAFADPTQFWRICDANEALWPEDLTAVTGRRIDIPSPFGQTT
jgi:hypothetical protein